MPSHIDVRLGRWAEAAAANEKAMAADERYNARKLEPGFWGLYMAHNQHFLGLHRDDGGPARGRPRPHARAWSTMFPAEFVKENALFADAFMTVAPGGAQALRRVAGRPRRQGRWSRGCPSPPPTATMTRAVALAALGRVTRGGEGSGRLPAGPARGLQGRGLGVQHRRRRHGRRPCPIVEGEIAYRKGDKTAAIAKLREAVALEDALKYDEPPRLDGAHAPFAGGGAHRLTALRGRGGGVPRRTSSATPRTAGLCADWPRPWRPRAKGRRRRT